MHIFMRNNLVRVSLLQKSNLHPENQIFVFLDTEITAIDSIRSNNSKYKTQDTLKNNRITGSGAQSFST